MLALLWCVLFFSLTSPVTHWPEVLLLEEKNLQSTNEPQVSDELANEGDFCPLEQKRPSCAFSSLAFRQDACPSKSDCDTCLSPACH